MLQKIAIKMLGDFSVVADGRCVVDATAKLTKPWQLFCYLALNREHVTPSSVLLQELWGGEELADPAVRRMEKQSLRSAGGVEIKVPVNVYRDESALEFIRNPDGSMSLLIKNIIV